jgi:hypothetical protein
VELSVVKAETRRRNVGRVLALVADRATDLRFAWDNAEAYWGHNPGRAAEPEVFVKRVRAEEPIRLRRVLPPAAAAAPGRLGLTCVLDTDPSEDGKEVPREVKFVLGGVAGVAPAARSVILGAKPRTVVLDVEFAGLPAGALPKELTLEAPPRRPGGEPSRQAAPIPAPGQAAAPPSRIVLRVRDPAGWLKTAAELQRKDAGAPFRGWREGMARRGLAIADLPFEASDSPPADAVVFDDRLTPESGSPTSGAATPKPDKVVAGLTGPSAADFKLDDYLPRAGDPPLDDDSRKVIDAFKAWQGQEGDWKVTILESKPARGRSGA